MKTQEDIDAEHQAAWLKANHPNPLKDGPTNDNWRTLPEICMALHMRHTGADESLSDAQYEEAVGYLRGRTERWSPIANGPAWYCFDTAVLSLCLVTLDEAAKHIIAVQVQVDKAHREVARATEIAEMRARAELFGDEDPQGRPW